MSLLAASEDSRIQGVVLLDSIVPEVWPQHELDRNLQAMRAQYDEIREKAPELAKVAIPWAEALPDTLKRVDGIRLSDTLPIIDIVAEHGQDNPASTQTWRDAHTRFAAHHPAREYLLALGSSHKVVADKPDLVIDAIARMLEKIRR
jgi:pimeloyl-ACP methyl ester carboxylesterase